MIPQTMEDRTSGERVTWLGLWGNVLLVIAKIAVGVFGRSQALIADGVHSLTDLVSDFITLAALKVSGRPRDRNHQYGHGKVEDLAALAVGLILVITAIMLGRHALLVLQSGLAPKRSFLLLATAMVSVLIKEWLHQRTRRVGRQLDSPTLLANAAHHRSDALSSLATVVGIGLYLVHPAFLWADTAAALIVAVLIIYAGVKICLQACRDLMDTAPSASRTGEVEKFVSSLPGVCSLNGMRARLYAGHMALDLEIGVQHDLSVLAGHDIAQNVEERILEQFPIVYDVMVHIEPAICRDC
ncbi:MAG: cation transporter [bacterium]|nr:cation transporter [bacterium]